jgi:acyl dehydratase
VSEIAVGTEIPAVEETATLHTSVRYAGASGDFNPLHYDETFAEGVSPTGATIAHGMYSMGLASRALTAFAGGPDNVADLQVRFTRPWPIGVSASFSGKVTEVADGRATVELTGTTADGERILRGTGVIRL